MKGAREYAGLFETGQYDRFYIVSGSHARGRTFHIQILPEGELAKRNGKNNLCLNRDAVEVYGIVSGHPGWTETYGWLHHGKWEEDFYKLVAEKKDERARASEEERQRSLKLEESEVAREQRLLDNY